MSPLMLILIVLVVLVLFGGGLGYHRGYYASNAYYGPGIGIVGIIVVVLLILLLSGRL